MDNKLKQIIEKYNLKQKQVNECVNKLMHKGLADLYDTTCMLAIIEVLTELEKTAKGE